MLCATYQLRAEGSSYCLTAEFLGTSEERGLLIKSDHILPSLQGPHDFRAAWVCPLDLCAQHPSGVTRCPAEPLAQGCLTATRSAEWREPCQGADPVDGGDPQLTEGS